LDPHWESWWVDHATQHFEYRLDDYWCLDCEFTNNNNSLMRWELSPNWQAISIQPSTNFNGTWVNYYANGQKYSEGNFINGIRSGEFTYLHSDGSKERIVNYNLGKYDGPWTLFSALGRTVIAGQFSNQVRVGIWTYYNADGSTNSVVDNSQKKTN
jgi:antitoxin component YwqK of YwqJK toxin-antitoxin module